MSTKLAVVAGQLYSVGQTAELDNSGISVVWERLARGEYVGIKDGARTKITGESILERRARLPRAEFKPSKPRTRAEKGFPSRPRKAG